MYKVKTNDEGRINLPKISVILATYNNEKYIREAIESILKQTYSNFELIVIDDASTDKTGEIINSIIDKRIIYLRNKKNQGPPYSINRGIDIAKGDYIARLDGDDISMPTRLEEQLKYMELNKDISICGCIWKEFGRSNNLNILPEDTQSLKVNSLFYSPLAHSSWFIRRSVIFDNNIKYNNSFKTAQDYEFIYRILKNHKIACVQKVLLLYRVHPQSITGKTVGVDKNTMKVQKKILLDLNIQASKRDLLLLNSRESCMSAANFLRLFLLFRNVKKKNEKYLIYDQEKLVIELKRRLLLLGKNDKITKILLKSLF